MRVLLVEDDSPTAQSVELMVKSENHNIYITGLGEEGMDLAKQYDYDVMLLNDDLPDMDGVDVLKALRVARVTVPIIMLASRGGIEDKVRALGFGADDYITKPFHRDDLLARMDAVARRCGRLPQVPSTETHAVGMPTQVSFETSVRVKLTPKGVREFEHFFESLREGQQQPRSAYPTLPTPDDEGWYAMELWMLVSVFGGMNIRHPQHTAELFEGNLMELDVENFGPLISASAARDVFMGKR